MGAFRGGAGGFCPVTGRRRPVVYNRWHGLRPAFLTNGTRAVPTEKPDMKIDMQRAARSGKDDDKAVNALMDHYSEVLEGVGKSLDKVHDRQLASLLSQLTLTLGNCMRRSKETTHRDVIVKAARRLITQLQSDIMNSDPGDLGHLLGILGQCEMDASIDIALNRLRSHKAKLLEEEREKERQEAVKAREEVAAKKAAEGPLDGPEQDLAGKDEGFSEEDLGAGDEQ